MYLKELMLIRQMHENSVIFVIIGFSNILVLNMNHTFPMDVMV